MSVVSDIGYSNMLSQENIQPLSRFASIRSSLSSIYRNYDFHLGLIKVIGLAILLSLLSATLALTSSMYQMENAHNSSDCIRLSGQTFGSYELNDSTCLKQFELPDNELFVSVCIHQQSTIIDFRQFAHGKPTKHGLYLTLNQWKYLKRLHTYIDNSIQTHHVKG